MPPRTQGNPTPTVEHLAHTTIGQDTTSIDDLHQRLADSTWRAQRGDIVIVDAAAAADPAKLADLTKHAAQQQARIILLDTTPATWPPQPSAPLLHLAHTDLRRGAPPSPIQQPQPAAAQPPDRA
jgi:DNA-binding MurR/RpiR family transcriptional regulator